MVSIYSGQIKELLQKFSVDNAGTVTVIGTNFSSAHINTHKPLGL
jgi:hypothetical protein